VTEEYVLISPRSRRLHAGFRLAVAAAWLALGADDPTAGASSLPAPVYFIYAGVVMFRSAVRRPAHSLLLLVADTFGFVLAAATLGEGGFWLLAAFHLHLMITAVVFHQWRQVAVISGVSTGYLLVLHPPHWERLLPVVLALEALALVTAMLKDNIERGLFGASTKAVKAAADAESARADERERIASDFHDGPLQSFMGLQMRVEVVRRMFDRDPAAAARELQELQELLKGQVAELRAFLRAMRAPDHAAAPVTASVSRLASTFERETGIETTFATGGAFEGAEPAASAEIFQIVQEALNNIRKHSGATRVSVTLERSDGQVTIGVGDNGRGFPFAGAYSLAELELLRLGPLSIRRRVQALSGAMTIESRPGFGSHLKITIPA
jgi:signal transduction histidine kinase